MKNSTVLFQFFGLLFILIVPAYFIQNMMGVEDDDLSLQFTYAFNLCFTVPFTVTVILFKNLIKQYIGFIFMGIGFVKITVFLVFSNLNDIDVSRDNFLLFFVPYVLCMVAEIFVLVRYLNRANF
ncbi:MAG: hypothetical protein GVY05_10380 [Bacteroidetes bacterium]|nr:hypothetical protein [Bacteroidota bacterium]